MYFSMTSHLPMWHIRCCFCNEDTASCVPYQLLFLLIFSRAISAVVSAIPSRVPYQLLFLQWRPLHQCYHAHSGVVWLVSAMMSHLPTLSHQLLTLQWCHISQHYCISCCFFNDVTSTKVIASTVVSAVMSQLPKLSHQLLFLQCRHISQRWVHLLLFLTVEKRSRISIKM